MIFTNLYIHHINHKREKHFYFLISQSFCAKRERYFEIWYKKFVHKQTDKYTQNGANIKYVVVYLEQNLIIYMQDFNIFKVST